MEMNMKVARLVASLDMPVSDRKTILDALGLIDDYGDLMPDDKRNVHLSVSRELRGVLRPTNEMDPRVKPRFSNAPEGLR